MDFREFMKQEDPENKKKEASPEKSPAAMGLSARHQEFEKLYQSTLELTQKIWKEGREGKPIDLASVKQAAEKWSHFLSKGQEGVTFFQSYKVPYYYQNTVNVTLFSVLMGMELQYPQERLTELATAALLHDIGMSKIDPKILTKKEKLSFDEYELIRHHPGQGKEILSAVEGVSSAIVAAVSQEHERENGSGYPEGLRGNQIHEFAKIIGLADAFEGLTHPRDYREPISANEAIMQILAMKGRLFLEKYIKCFLNVFTFYPLGSYVQLNTNEVGRVVQVDKKAPTRPIIQLIIDREGVPVSSPQYMNLTEKDLIFVKETLTEEKVRFALEGKK